MIYRLIKSIIIPCLVGVIFTSQNCYSQSDSASYDPVVLLDHKEYISLNSSDQYYLINGYEEGLLVINETRSTAQRNSKSWVIESLDSTLTQKWGATLSSSPYYKYSGYEWSPNRYAMLFELYDYASNVFVAWTFDNQTGDTATYYINTIVPVNLSEFETVGNTIILSGESAGRTVVVIYNMESKKSRVIPGYYDPTLEILKIIPDNEDSTYLIINRRDFPEKKRVITYRLIDSEGTDRVDFELPLNLEKSFTFGIPTHLSLNEGILIGTFTRGKSVHDQGFYALPITENPELRYYEFSDLNRFFSYLPKNQEARIKGKAAAKLAQGKKLRRSYKLTFADVLSKDSAHFFVVEVYRDLYGSLNNYNPYAYYNSQSFFNNRRSSFSAPTVKTGYEYSHAVILKIDNNGELIWDNIIEMNYMETSQLKKNVFTIADSGDAVSSIYLNKSRIYYQKTAADTVTNFSLPVTIAGKNRQVASFRDDHNHLTLNHWYNRSFYVTGRKNVALEKGSRRSVLDIFFINRMEVADEKIEGHELKP